MICGSFNKSNGPRSVVEYSQFMKQKTAHEVTFMPVPAVKEDRLFTDRILLELLERNGSQHSTFIVILTLGLYLQLSILSRARFVRFQPFVAPVIGVTIIVYSLKGLMILA